MLRKDWMKMLTSRTRGLALLVGVMAFLAPSAAKAAATTPPVVATVSNTVASSGLPAGMLNTLAQDACGNIYAIQGNNNGALPGGSIYEIPAGGGEAVEVWTGTGDSSSWDSGFYVSINPSKSSLYFENGDFSSPQGYSIPIVNCALQTSQIAAIASGEYTFNSAPIAFNAAGDAYYVRGGQTIEEYAPGSSSATTIVSSVGAANNVTGIALDSQSNLYYIDGDGNVYELAYSGGTYSSTPTTVATGYTSTQGITLDAQGDMYVADGGSSYGNDSTIYFIPNLGTTSSPSLNADAQYPVVTGITYDYNGATPLSAPVIFDALGNYYWVASGSPITEETPSTSFGSVAVGSTATENIELTFNSAVTPATINVVSATGVFSNTSSGTCSAATAYAAGSSCTVSVQFAPTTPGPASGSVLLLDSLGNQLATVNVSGTGTGAAINVDPGAVSSFGSGYSAPAGVAMDNQGDVFIADASQNAVLEVAVGSTSAATLASGFNAPIGVAVDGAGNVYVSDTGNSQIDEIPVVNGALSSTSVTLIASGTSVAGEALNGPTGITVDAAGNLYIADTGNSRVVYVPYVGSWDLSLAVTLGSGISSPSSIAVDASGNVYVADTESGNVDELTAPISAGVQVTAASGFSSPSDLAVDPSGALFVVDQGNQKVWRIPSVSGSLVPTSAINVTGQLNASATPVIADPYGIALDPSGNLYVSDKLNGAAYVVARTNSTQSFGLEGVGMTTGEQGYYIEDSGNATLTLGSPFYTESGDTADFTILSGETGVCASSGTVAVGSGCNLQAEFMPSDVVGYTDTLTLASNAYATGQQLSFTGTGYPVTTTTTTFAITSPAGSISFDEPISLTATVETSTGSALESGSVNLVVDGTTVQTVALNASGQASFTIVAGAISGGSHTLAVNYLGSQVGSTVYAQSGSGNEDVSVLTVPTTTGLSYTTLYVDPNSQPKGTAIVFTATVASQIAVAPTGTVSFTFTDASGTLVTGTGILKPAAGGAYQATYTYANTTSPASGSAFDAQSVVASYGGDSNFAGSSAASSSFDVSPAGGSVQATESGNALIATASSSGTVTFTATSYGGWTGVVGFTCDPSTLPANATCVFAPGQLQITPSTATAVQPPNTMTLSVAIKQPSQTPTAAKMLWWIAIPTGMVLLFMRRRLKSAAASTWFGALLLIVATGAISAGVLGTTACNATGYQTPQGLNQVTVYAWSDPFIAGTTTSTTQACGLNSSGVADPTIAPCTRQAFTVNVTVQ